MARVLLSRYVDASGYVKSRAVEGVVRLAGLGAREAAELRAGAQVRLDADGAAAADPGRTGASPSGAEPGADETPLATVATTTDEAAGATGSDLAEAITAALAVLEADRFERRPGKRLLGAEAEVGLAALVRGGPDRIAHEPDEEELKSLPRDDLRIRARDCLVVHNQGLVHSLARTMLEQGLDYEDLFQHGVLGLMRAARKFNPLMGNKFSTYATWWVRQSITRAIADEGAVIRIPVHMHEQMRKVANAERSLAAQGRPATAADVAVACDLSLAKVEEIRRLSRRTDSLDRVIGDGATLADFVERTQPLPSVERDVLGAMHVQEIMAVVNTFTGRDHRILVRRLGLDGDDPSTLDEVGREFGVTRERIRQLEQKLRPALVERLRMARVFGVRAVSARTEPDSAAAGRGRTARVSGTKAGPPARIPITQSAPAAPLSNRAETTPPAAASADWGRARRLAKEPSGQSWLAEYALTAVGHEALVELLGQSAADAVLRVARDREPADRLVLTALEVLRRVFDNVAEVGLRPEDFFDHPAEALRGVTPRTYLASRPLVNGESRLAVRDALREFLAAAPPLRQEPDEAQGTETGHLIEARDAEGEEDAPKAERVDDAEESGGHPPAAVDVREAPSLDADAEDEDADDEDTDADPGATVSVGAPQTTADWNKALTLTQPPLGSGVAWLAEYALLALGHLQLSVLLGSSAADAVVRAARQRGMLNRHVVRALEVLQGVFDAVKGRGLRPEHFFERPAEALAGATPRAYLATKPLVRTESRLAVRDALREFIEARPERTEPVPENSNDGDVSTSGEPTSTLGEERPASSEQPSAEEPPAEEPSVEEPVDTDRLLGETRARYEAEITLLAQEHERRLSEERRGADERLAAVRAEAERQLDALEEELLNRADRSRARREMQMRRQAEEHLTRLKEQHREAYEALLRRAEHAEEAARQAVGAEQRVHDLEQRLREYREGAEARITDLESRLRQAQAAAAERERAAGAWVAELETRLEKTEAAAAERERAAASAREEYRQGAQVRAAEVEARLREAEAAVAQRDLFVEAARRRAEEAEQQAAQRIAQSEHNAWLRITDLQTQLGDAQAQLAAAREAAQSRTLLRDRWRRS
ncbi:sigma-70 family RNA polymerase sigma factor [Streptomyces yanii]|uniref:Sigma-70 family RNA polymerase sigma factor n=1 Tax=Streptomyces yanii TaxID=78510 RepID=A0ABV5R1D2_9ACTN